MSLLPRVNTGGRYRLPRLINTPERKVILQEKAYVNVRFWGRNRRVIELIKLLLVSAKTKKERKRLNNIKKMVKLMGEDFVSIRQVESKVNAYDEFQRFKQYKFRTR